jgi:hypothetical protein
MTDDCLLTTKLPALLIIANDENRGVLLKDALQGTRWQVETPQGDANVCERAATGGFSLILLDLEDAQGVFQMARAIRTYPAAGAAAPILSARPQHLLEHGCNAQGVDAALPADRARDSLAQWLDTWRPVSLEPTRRIAEMIGSGPIAGMIERLGRRLEAAMIGLDRGTFDKAEAHRLAGLCGTLGFGQAHAAWLDLSTSNESALEDVRRSTRLTLSAIARGL